jgi:rhodanese-related sulfurtransferase
MQAQELARKLKSGGAPAVIDVRTGFEYDRGHIPGAIHAPTWKILLFLAKLPSDKNTEMVLTCEHGPRAQIAKGILGTLGYRNLDLLEGHMNGWRKAGLPTEK